MKATKMAIILLLVASIALVAWRLTKREPFWSPVAFTSPPSPLLMRGYVGTFPGAVLPDQNNGNNFEYTTLPFTWSRV